MASDKVDKYDAVKCSERMVADGNKGSLWEIVQNFLVVNTEFYFKFLEKKTFYKFGSGGVTTVGVCRVDLVYP